MIVVKYNMLKFNYLILGFFEIKKVRKSKE